MRNRRIITLVASVALVAGLLTSMERNQAAVASTPSEPLPPVCGTWVLQQVSSAAELDKMRSQLDAALRTPGVRGLSVRAPWNKVDGDLSIFNRAYDIAKAAGKELSIRVMAGRHTPARVFDLGAYSYVDNGQRIPKPFSNSGVAGNPVFEREYQDLVNTLGSWSRDHDVHLLHLPWYGRLWAEIDNGPEIRASQGYSVDAWTKGHLSLLDMGLAESGANLSVEYAMSGYWGNSGSEAVKFHERIINTVGQWSPRAFLQGNALGVSNFPAASGRPINTGGQMYDGAQYNWQDVYAFAASSGNTYVEVYTSSFTGNTNGALANASAAFNSRFNGSCNVGPDTPSPSSSPSPVPSLAPSPTPSVSPSPAPSSSPSPAPSSSPTPSPGPIVPSPVPLDEKAPQTTMTDPRSGATLPMGTVRIGGEATDDLSVGVVSVAIRNRVSRLWRHADGTWGGYETQPAVVSGSGSTAASWSFDWSPSLPGSYIVVARAEDGSGNADASPAGGSITIGSDSDPGVASASALHPAGSPRAQENGRMVLRGVTSDDESVGAVRVGVLDKRTDTWWHHGDTWGGKHDLHAELRTPGRVTSRWVVHLRVDPGKYRVRIVSIDSSGNRSVRWMPMKVTGHRVRIGSHLVRS